MRISVPKIRIIGSHIGNPVESRRDRSGVIGDDLNFASDNVYDLSTNPIAVFESHPVGFGISCH